MADIEREWPLIAAELDLLDAEIAVLSAEGGVSVLDRPRVRRAERRALVVGRELAAEDITTLTGQRAGLLAQVTADSLERAA